MKLLLPTLIFLTIFSYAFSQSITLKHGLSDIKVLPGEEIRTSFQITNNNTKAIRLSVRAQEDVLRQELAYSICYQQECWQDFSSLKGIIMQPGQTLEDFSLKFRAAYDLNIQELKLEFFDADNPSDRFSHVFTFTIQDQFSNGTLFAQDGIRVSNAYPNPTSSLANIDFSISKPAMDAYIVVHNLLGNKMTEVALEQNEANAKIFTDNFDNGIYFYSLYVNGKRVSTKKIVVRK